MEPSPHSPGSPPGNAAAIEISKLSTRFGEHVVHSGLDLEVRSGEIFALIGGSGSGKSTLLREMILLQQPDSGTIRVLGVDLQELADQDALVLRQRWGVMFQHGGLFGSLTVSENVGLPLREHTALDGKLIDEIAAWKLALSGLAPEVGAQYPSELSGGMMKRASLARALINRPKLLLADEPTGNLDTRTGTEIMELIQSFNQSLGMTVLMVTHEQALAEKYAGRMVHLADGKLVDDVSIDDVPNISSGPVQAPAPRGETQ